MAGPDDPSLTLETGDDDYQTKLETARTAGWSWGDIFGHIGAATLTAANAGYSQREIDDHLGFADPAGFEYRAASSWAQWRAANPDKPPVASENPATRSDYAEALKAHEVKGPVDFMERYTDAAPGVDFEDAQALERTLPTREDLADATVALSPKTNFDTQNAPGMVAPGNVDPWNRPALHNPDGSYSTTS